MIETEKRPNHRPPKVRAIDPEDLDKSFYTVAQVAEMMGFHYRTIHRMIHEGKLPAKKYGKEWRIRVDDLLKYTEPETGV